MSAPGDGSGRIPLWVDLSHVPASARSQVEAAAQKVGVDRILNGQDDGVVRITIRGAADQEQAAAVEGTVIVDSEDWTIIPLENLIAARRDRPGTLFAVARSPQEAVRFRHVLDVGVHGIALAPDHPEDVQTTADALQNAGPRPDDQSSARAAMALVPATISSIQDAGNAERVCVDCTERFQDGEGLLVGSTAASFILVHAETIQTDYVNARPFRVNAGAVHSYTMAPDGRTSYLSELAAGSKVLAITADGTSRNMTIGRAKIEHRPHSLVAWRTDENVEGSAVVQTAETVRFVRPDGSPLAVTDLQVGDSVLVHGAGTARHMGMPVQERLVEK